VLSLYLAFAKVAAPVYRWQLARRVRADREHPQRYTEKLGVASATRPEGTLIWLHAVGLGEVLALRGLIAAIHQQAPDIHFLVTSGTKASGEVFATQQPINTIHQYAPLDTTPCIKKFIDHWQPQLSVWAEQDIWPALVCACHDRKIPLALVNARMNQASYKKRARLTGLCKTLYGKFLYVSAQDTGTADHLQALGAKDVDIGGSIKSAAMALKDQPAERKLLADKLATRFIWLLASSHEADELLALKAHKELIKSKKITGATP